VDDKDSRDDVAPSFSLQRSKELLLRFRDACRKYWPRCLIGLALICGLGLVLLLGYVVYLIPTTPSVQALREARTSEPSILLTSDGEQLGAFNQVLQQKVDLDHVSPRLIDALIATEDHRFFEHHGVDVGRTVSAFFHTMRGNLQGGSTITQQLARNLFPEEIGRSRTVSRKLKEMVTAIKIERAYSKREILEAYLNGMPFLHNVVGIEMAARTYYDKPASELDAMESATLVGMLKGPRYYDPVTNPERALKRRNLVLGQMAKRNLLPEADYRALCDQPLQLRFNRLPEPFGLAPHFAAYVRKWVSDWADKNDYNLYADGLVIHTTIDSKLQAAAAAAVERQAETLQTIANVEWGRPSPRLLSSAPTAYTQMRKPVEPFAHYWNTHRDLLEAFVRDAPEYKKAIKAGESDAAALARLEADGNFMAALRADKTRFEAGLVAIEPTTGQVKAWVGSRDFRRDQFDHVAQAERQPGSAFKPVVYGAALERGLRPERIYFDNPVEVSLGDGETWRPGDMSGSSGSAVTLREGLIYSKNAITVQIMQEIGLYNIVSLARALGINRSPLDPVPSLALGTSPVTLLEMVSAYATIAQEGEYRKPVVVTRITDRAGKLIAEFDSPSQQEMSKDTAIQLIDIMRGVVTQGTGTAVKTRFGIAADIAGKTGTTQHNTDSWFILMHPNLVAGAWTGFNDQRVTMRTSYWGQGGHNAVLIVGDFFREALKGHLIDANAQFPRPYTPMMVVGEPPAELEPQSGQGMGAQSEVTRAPMSPQELEEIMRAMNRDAANGASVDAAGGAREEMPPRQER
jgi:penicillin-binding protein 1A